MNEKDSPCASVVITADLSNCLTEAKASAEAQLNWAYIMTSLKLGRDDAARLLAVQHLWAQYRDANCEAERAIYSGGSAAYPAYVACIEAMTRARVKEIQVTYVLPLK